jgi:tRNA-specific 2-thiouridylase
VAAKPDSHDICFIPTGDTAGWLDERLGTRPGQVVDALTGAVLSEHSGVHHFTVGQRRGIGVGAPAADGRPRYVLGIEPVSGTVRVGPAEGLDVREIVGERPVWASGRAPDGPLECVAQVRAHGGLADSVAAVEGPERDVVRVALRSPLRGVAPGQAVALYRPDPGGDVVLGSATIR